MYQWIKKLFNIGKAEKPKHRIRIRGGRFISAIYYADNEDQALLISQQLKCYEIQLNCEYFDKVGLSYLWPDL